MAAGYTSTTGMTNGVNASTVTVVTSVIDRQVLADKILNTINDDEVNRLVPSIIYTFLLLVVGLPGNLLVLYIYYFKWKRCNSKYFIFTMALFDCFNCFIGLPTEIVIMMNIYKFDNPAVCKLSRFTTFTMNGASAITLLVVAIDRFIRICRPMSKTMSCKLAFRLCIFAIVFAVFSNCTSLVIYGTFTPYKVIHNTTVVFKMCLIANDMYDSPIVLGFYIWIFIGFFAIAIVVTVLYVFIGIQVWKRRNLPTLPSPDGRQTKKKMLTSISTDDSSDGPRPLRGSIKAASLNRRMSKSTIRIGRSTFTLFLITVIYYVSYVPYLVLALIRTANPKFGNDFTASEDRAYQLFLRSYLLSSAINPIIYSFFNTEFRRWVKKLFRLRCSGAS